MSDKVKKTLGIVFLGGVLLVVLPLLFAGNSNDKEVTIATPTPVQETKMSSFKEGFINGCSDDGTEDVAYCECAYDYLLKEWGEDKFIDFAIEYSTTDEFPEWGRDKLVDTLESCVHLVD